jgi:gamma-glutamylcyclotransferase (GGCT)/AIG2-like uncharacterized protein YtfP
MTKRDFEDEAEETPEERAAIRNVFVFGTLMRGEPMHDLVRKHGLELAILAEVRGRLYEVDGRPVLVLSDDPKEWVHGELIRCRDREGLFRELQVVHESRVPVAAVPACRRELVAVGMMDGHVREGWAYVCDEPPPGAVPIPSGDWREHRGTRKAFLKALVRAHCGRSERRIARELARLLSIGPEDVKARSESLLPLADGLEREAFSERQLAQITDKWAVEVEVPTETRPKGCKEGK